MTTPAKDTFVQTTAFAHRLFWSGGSDPLGPIIKSEDSEHRPESAPAGSEMRFKLCGSWYHRGSHWTQGSSTCAWHAAGSPSIWFVDSGNIFDVSFPTPILPNSNMRNAGLTKALVKLQDQDIHLGNFMAEFHQVLSMFNKNAKLIAGQVESFRKKRPKDFQLAKQNEGSLPRNKWCLIPNSWLEMQYGWNPLLSDLYGAVMHISKRAQFSNPFITVRSRRENTVIDKILTNDQCGNTYWGKWKHSQKCTTFLVYGTTNPTVRELSSLGLINPLEIVWELSKFSFVVDWLVPVSSWLQTWTSDAGLKFITGGQGLTTKTECLGSEVATRSGFVTMTGVPVLNVGGYAKSYERACYTSSPVPGLYVKNPLTPMHTANALALLAQAFAHK